MNKTLLLVTALLLISLGAAGMIGDHEKGECLGPGSLQTGCQIWAREQPSSAVEPFHDDQILTAHLGQGELHVSALDLDGQPVWKVSHPVDRTAATKMDIELQEDDDAAYIAWHAQEYGTTIRWGEDTFKRGALAKISLTDGDLLWKKEGANAPIQLSPDNEHVYHAYATSGAFGGSENPLRNDPSEIRVVATNTTTGDTNWQNGTDIWWHIHAPHENPKTSDWPYCYAGPADIEVHPNGTVFAAPARSCYKVTGAIAGFDDEGDLMRLWTYPAPLDDPASPPDSVPAQRDAALALHPRGHTLYVAGSQHIAAYHVDTGHRLWFREAGPVSANFFGANTGPGDWQSDTVTMGVDIAATPAGLVLVTAFDEPEGFHIHEDRLVPRLLVLDGLTGEPVTREPDTLAIEHGHQDSWFEHSLEATHREGIFDTEIHLDADGLIAYTMYRAQDDARVLGYLVTGEQTSPLWEPYGNYPTRTGIDEATHPLGEPRLEAPEARDVAIAHDRIIVADDQTRAFSKGLKLEALSEMMRELEPVLDQAQTHEAWDATERAAMGVLHGAPVTESTPMITVNATDKLHASVNLTEPGLYYLKVKGVEPVETYAFQTLAYDPFRPDEQKENVPFWHARFWGVTTPDETCNPAPYGPIGREISRANGACERGGFGACEEDLMYWWRAPGNVEGKCWTTEEGGPIVVTQGDKQSDDEPGAALFGPFPFVDGDYAIVKPEGIESSLRNPTPLSEGGVGYADECVDRQPWVDTGVKGRGDHLELCLEVNIQAEAAGHSFDSAAMIENAGDAAYDCLLYTDCPQPSPVQQGSSASNAQACRTDAKSMLYQIPLPGSVHDERSDRDPPDEDLIEEGFITDGVQMGVALAWAFGEDAESGECRADFEVLTTKLGYALFGETEFNDYSKWELDMSVEGTCSGPAKPKASGGCERSFQALAHRPGSFLPDHEYMHVAQVGQAGTSAMDNYRTEARDALICLVVTVGASVVGGFLGGVAATAGCSLYAASKYLFSTETGAFEEANITNVECGGGCKEWGAFVREPENFGHDLVMEATACEEFDYPIAAGQRGMLAQADWPAYPHWDRMSWYEAFDPIITQIRVNVAVTSGGSPCV